MKKIKRYKLIVDLKNSCPHQESGSILPVILLNGDLRLTEIMKLTTAIIICSLHRTGAEQRLLIIVISVLRQSARRCL